ncbi:MAG: hypothetical protein AMS18_14880 [Gemmatimonas sp. SG8_17]|nr:MAG: hypothetical protein AMS18_14880 [Gemmatimonas sp. SG8_17]
MMRRFLLVLAGALACSAGVTHGQTVVFGVGGQLSAPLGEYFRVPVYADLSGAGGAALGSFTVRVTWNPDSLYGYYQVESAGFGGTIFANTDSVYNGVIRVAGVTPSGASGLVELFRIRVQFSYYHGTSPINIEVLEASAAGTFEDLTPFVTTVDGVACPALGRWGDLDGDLRANSRDALAILSDVVGMSTVGFDIALGDVDGDGLANSRDALILLSYAVGIDIAGQRVLLVAPGACVTPEVPQLTIVPDTIDLAVNQRFRPLLTPIDGSDNPSGVNALSWFVDDPTVAAVMDERGTLVGRGEGTTTLWAALGPGVMVSTPVVVRAQRGTWWVDTEVALGQPVQLGTEEYPLAWPNRAFLAVAEGDTIRVKPGTHEFSSYWEEEDANLDDLYHGVVFIGDTLPDGTRPILRGPEGDGRVQWWAGDYGRIQDLVLQNAYFYIDGLNNLHVENVRFESTFPEQYRDAIEVQSHTIDTLSIVKSDFVDPFGTNNRYAVAVWRAATFVRLHDSQFSGWYSSAYLYDVDSLDVQRNRFEYTNVALGSWTYDQSRPYATAVVVDNVVDRARQGIWISADDLVLTDNVATGITDDGVTGENVSGRAGTGAVVSRNQVTCEASAASTYGLQAHYAPSVIEDNTVTDCHSYGIYHNYGSGAGYPLVDATLRRNTVTMRDSAAGTAARVGGRIGLLRLYGNTFRKGYYGVNFSVSLNTASGDTTGVIADSNAVSGSGYYGMYLNISTSYTGSMVGIRNNISGNRLGIYTSFNGPMSFTHGQFVGNWEYAVYSSYAFDATQNWWGDPADAIFGPVDTSSSLPSAPTDVPPLAPPAASALAVQEALGPATTSEDRLAAVHERVRKTREEHLARRERQ